MSLQGAVSACSESCAPILSSQHQRCLAAQCACVHHILHKASPGEQSDAGLLQLASAFAASDLRSCGLQHLHYCLEHLHVALLCSATISVRSLHRVLIQSQMKCITCTDLQALGEPRVTRSSLGYF